MTAYDVAASRASLLPKLRAEGFIVAPNLPHLKALTLRPALDIARRLLAVRVVTDWVAADEGRVTTDVLHTAVERHQLGRFLSAADQQMLATPRPQAKGRHLAELGWAFEGAWACAWVLGFPKVPGVQGGMIDDATIVDVMLRFSPSPTLTTLTAWVADHPSRDEELVVGLEDGLSCVHNAARSAQLGAATVPAGFHPVIDGGVVQERRRALLWCLSPDVRWDDTDVST